MKYINFCMHVSLIGSISLENSNANPQKSKILGPIMQRQQSIEPDPETACSRRRSL